MGDKEEQTVKNTKKIATESSQIMNDVRGG